MPWFRHPLHWRLRQPDPTCPIRVSIRAQIEPEIERPSGPWVRVKQALVDTGASFTILSASWANSRGIPVPTPFSRMPLLTAAGNRDVRVRDADLRVGFPRLRDHPFERAVLFSDDYPPTAPPLIGLHNLLTSWRFTFDGAPEPGALMGHLLLETL
jgi:predicted aspartyl protease